MRIREKIITAACRTADGIEWTSLKIRQDGSEPAGKGSVSCPSEDNEGQSINMPGLTDEVSEKLAGDLTVSIRTSELLMRTAEFPSIDREEIAGMVNFQFDKISPFPLDQLAISHEVLSSSENSSMVLMVAARHECIDAIGEAFKYKGVYIHSIDARILGWFYLLQKGQHLAGEPCEVLIVDDGIDFSMTVLSDGIPLVFRSLSRPEDDAGISELAEEIDYTLTMLDSEHDLPDPQRIDIWSLTSAAPQQTDLLAEKTGVVIAHHDLNILPPLSEGIIERAIHKKARIELIPKEWIEHERMQRLKKKFAVSSGIIGGIWLVALLIFVGIYQSRAIALAKVQEKEASLAPQAQTAIENRKKLKALKNYADRSDSALECLREVTRLLPGGDIEFASYNYTQGKGVSLRGTAESDEIVYEYWELLNDSGLFIDLKDQRINNQVRQGEQRAVFSVNLVMPTTEDDK
ncbi:MAG: hypothetical protein JXR25_10775 [Pontiellaceae bacterium]|nr:hypothetical protein [Pontiellaceae bacterium]MBN2785304.1 hypothetical protein [Pontiellaceae bacterium]